MNPDLTTIPFIALYAETHFRFFRFFPSLLYKKQPEIFFDMPRRIEPGIDVPVMLMLNDINLYPVDITNVTIVTSQNGSSTIALSETDLSPYLTKHPFDFQSSVYLFKLPHHIFNPGRFYINGKVTIKQNKRTYEVLNNNFISSSKSALTGIIAEDHLPGHKWCEYGDLHLHSQYSRSHVEFGPPIKVIDTIAFTCGLSFIGITDHSYDLACKMDNYLEQDATLQGWRSIKEEITGESAGFKTTVILGEEISACNSKNKVIHFGALGISEFIPGPNDGARRMIKSEKLSIPEAIHNIEQQGGISFAAHPGAKTGIFQRILLNRGNWHLRDIQHNINAFQAVNNGFTGSWYRARKLWITTLLKRKKLPLIAGNDAHGDFNRYTAISVPFLQINENFNRYLAYARTGIYSKDVLKHSVLDAIKLGKTFITTGPYLGISATYSPQDSVVSHAEHSLEVNTLFILGISTYEFGAPRILRVFRGYYQSEKESLLSLYTYTDQSITITEKPTLDPEKGPGYLRAELICIKKDGTKTMAATSPCYLR